MALLRYLCVGTAIGALCVQDSGAASLDPTVVFNKVRGFVVGIAAVSKSGQRKSGSGVIVGQNEIVTNCHVISESENLAIQFSDGSTANSVPGGRISGLDLCLLVAPTGKRPSAEVGKLAAISVGQQVYALGNPLSIAETFSNGLVSGIRQIDGQTVIQTTAPISPGSSGGGLFDSEGRLIGVTTFTLIKGQNMNFALPAEYVTKLRSAPLSPVEATEHKQLTFKGVKFGTSIESFREAFPGATCFDDIIKQLGQAICKGAGIEYLGKTGSYVAGFQSGRMYFVVFEWPAGEKSGIAQLFSAIKERVSQYFGPANYQGARKSIYGGVEFSEATAGWNVSKNQRIGLQECWISNWLPCNVEGVRLDLTDRSFSYSAAPKADF